MIEVEKVKTEIALIGPGIYDRAIRIQNAMADYGKLAVQAIADDETAETAAKNFRELSKLGAELEKHRKDAKEPYLTKGNAVDAFFKSITTNLDKIKKQYNTVILAWNHKKEQERIAEQKRLDDIAEQKRLEAQKIADDARAAEQAALDAVEAAQLSTWDEDDDLPSAEAVVEHHIEVAIEAAEVAQTAELAVQSIVPEVALPQRKFAGVSMVDNWTAEVTDTTLAIEWAIKNNRPEFLTLNESAMKAMAKATKRPQAFPGWRIFNNQRMQSK